MRSPEMLIKAFEAATKENPIILKSDEAESFQKAMKLLGERYTKGNKKSNLTVWDSGISFNKDAVISPVDGKPYSNRKDWDNMLKANECVQVGNDFNKATEKKREIVGDFDCRDELGKVTYQVMEKYGH